MIKGLLDATANVLNAATKVDLSYYDLDTLTASTFAIREGCRVTLYQDAHCTGNIPAPIMSDGNGLDTSYVPGNCFEEIYKAILNAKRFIYITGWSVDTKISLLRRKPVFVEEDNDQVPPNGKMTIGELLKYKADQGVHVLLNIWDEALSMNVAGIQTGGIMCTYDEQTRAYFSGTKVHCKLSYRTGVCMDHQFLWTHHQKSVMVDAAPSPDSLFKSVSDYRACPYIKREDLGAIVSNKIQNLAASEADYGRPDPDGRRYAISAFMTCEHSFELIWNDEGSWCQPHNVSIFRPKPPEGWHILGDVAMRKILSTPDIYTKIFVVKEPPKSPYQSPILECPTGYERVWPEDRFYSTSGCVTFWKPIAPPGYHALGHVATNGEIPALDLIRCVHESALQPAHPKYEEDSIPLWKNTGTLRHSIGGRSVSIWRLSASATGIVSGTFCVRRKHKLPKEGLLDGEYRCLRAPPLGIDVCPKPGDENIYSSAFSVPSETIPLKSKRRIISFVGGLDLTTGRWDTPGHTLFSTLAHEHADDFLHGWGIDSKYGPREPWHDIHGKFEGPIARDVLANFEQRWRTQGKKGVPLLHIGSDFISIQEEEIYGERTWNSRLCRSIDRYSADISYIDNSIQYSYVQAIRKAKRFIYIENQYFMGSSKYWFHDADTKCINLIPYEIAARVAKSIEEDFYPIVAYILLPLYPEGYPADGAIQEQLAWQWNTMEMMYSIVHDALNRKKSNKTPIDYLKFLCIGAREVLATEDVPPKNTREHTLYESRRVPIYVHSKLMIIDDEYIILGSANINERSMAGNRDSEICVESWQPKFHNIPRPRGDVHKFRMSLWSEHVGQSFPEFLQPNTPECSDMISTFAEQNWCLFASDEPVSQNMHSHLMRYPMKVSDSGKIKPDPVYFPDTKAKVKGQQSPSMPDLLTC